MNALKQPRTFGVEEEYLLLDAVSGTPVNRAADLILAAPELGGQTEHEFFSSQLETVTPICRVADEAEAVLANFRTIVSKLALTQGVILAGTGLPPVGGDTPGTVAPKKRYRQIQADVRDAAEHQYATGLHVHVEIPSASAGVDVLSRLSRWAPVLLALTANSPLWCGKPTGFASWRHLMGLNWPVAGYPPDFADGDAYQRTVEQLVTTGVIPDAGLVSWVARLSQNYPTIEFRIADAQLCASDAVTVAVIIRSLVERAIADAEKGIERPRPPHALVNGVNWMAARDGLTADLIDPFSARSVPAFQLVDDMLSTIEAELDAYGDRHRVDQYVQRLRDFGGPASRQLSAFATDGIAGLLELFGGVSPTSSAA